MAKQRDRYQSRIDPKGCIPGTRAAMYDVSIALWLLKRFAEERKLLDETVTIGRGNHQQTWPVWELLDIANEALHKSVSPAISVYRRLQENAEAADLMAQALDVESAGPDQQRSILAWQVKSAAFARTLDNRAIVSRGWISQCRRTLARRAKTEKRGAA